MPEFERVLATGSPLWDLIIPVSDEFIADFVGEKGGTVQIPQADIERLIDMANAPAARHPGGAAGNTCRALAVLGGSTGMLGMIGRDQPGDDYIDTLRRTGADPAGLLTHPKLPTGICASFVTPDGERTMRSDLAASLAITPEDFKDFDFSGYDWLYLESYMLLNAELTRALLAAGRRSGLRLALDLSSFELVRRFKASLPGLLKSHVSLLFANRDEARALIGDLPDAELARRMGDLVECAVLKCGRDGAIVSTGSQSCAVTAEKLAEVVDSTGAGDAFAAGFLWGYTQHMSAPECARIGNLTAFRVIKQHGAGLSPAAAAEIKKLFLTGEPPIWTI